MVSTTSILVLASHIKVKITDKIPKNKFRANPMRFRP